MTYQECIQYLYDQLPMFQREGGAALKKDLTNIRLLCEALGHPERQFKSVHVAGTNGKGSVSHMIAAMLQATGCKVGLYTSPHYLDFRERIKIDGQYISKDHVVQFVQQIIPAIKEIRPSFFEITVAMAFEHFAREQVDWAVIETGLGGRLDSTNIILPQLSVITNISYDHQMFLGDTLAEIASEKAGIIKVEKPVVIGRYQADINYVFTQKAASCSSPLFQATSLVELKDVKELENGIELTCSKSAWDPFCIQLDVAGHFQIENCRTALAAVSILSSIKAINIQPGDIQFGLSHIRELAGLKGRWETLRKNPTVIADSGHNEDGLRHSIQQVMKLSYQTLRMVIGVVKDKDVTKMLQHLPENATYYWCAASIPRSLSPNELSQKAQHFKLKGDIYDSVEKAVKAAVQDSDANDLIYVGGSTFVVAEVLGLSL